VRILHILNALTLGGAQGLALRLIEGLQSQGVACELCVLSGPERTHPTWSVPIEPVYLCFAGDYRRPVQWARCVTRLTQVIADVRPDIVHSYTWLADVTAARACGRTRVHHVAHLVDRREWLRSAAWRHQARRWFSRRAYCAGHTEFLAVSNAVADFAARHIPVSRGLIDVVHNSIEVSRFSEIAAERREPANNQPVTLGMLGRLEEEKGHWAFLDAVEELIRRGAPIRARIAGDGPLRSDLERRVTRPALAGRVKVLGLIRDARDFYRKTDVFVVPSIHSEGLPTTILEAMASGCVVVATDVGGATEAIDSRMDGWVVPPNDSISLANALESIILDRRLRARLRRSARDRVAGEFDMKRMLDRILQIYTRVTTRPSTSATTGEAG
jgi:glycosyltransferase involved in cell wall biosynthesis